MTRKLKGNDGKMCLTADVDNYLIAAGYEAALVKFWDIRSPSNSPVIFGRCGQNTNCSNNNSCDDISSIIYANQNKNDVYISAGKYIYQIDTRMVCGISWNTPRFEFNDDDINQITISENDELLAAADDDNTITVINLKNSRLLTSLKKHKNVVYTVQFRPGKPRELISGGFDCSLIHWDVFKNRAMHSFNLSDLMDPNWELPKSFNPSYVLSCGFGTLYSPAGKPNIVMAGTENGNLHCFHCEKNLLHYQTFKAHDLGVTKVYLTSSYQELAFSGSNDGKIKIWNVEQLFTKAVMAATPYELVSIDHGNKINHLCSVKDEYLIICDTSCDITIQPMSYD